MIASVSLNVTVVPLIINVFVALPTMDRLTVLPATAKSGYVVVVSDFVTS